MWAWKCALTMGLSLSASLLATASEPKSSIEAAPAIGRDFRGSIVYKGIYSGAFVKQTRRGSETKPLDGAFTFTATFDGAAVKVRTETTGLLRFGNNALSGVVNNEICKLYDRELLEGRCDFEQFNASTSFQRGNQSGQFRFEGKAVSVEDFAVRDAKRAAQAAEDRKRAEAVRAEELVARAKMRAQLPAGAAAKYKPLLDGAVTADAAHWFSNRYAIGSIDLVGLHRDVSSGSTFLKAYFQYVGGREAWVAAIVNKGGQVQCLQFWDDSSGCRGVGNGANAKIAAGFIAGMLSSGGSNSNSNTSSEREPCTTRDGERGLTLFDDCRK
jgi:hypothetical protein